MADIVREVMTPNPLAVSTQTRLEEVAQVMRANDVGDVLVTEDSRLAGILTDRDIVVRAIAMGRNPAATLAEECCSREVHMVHVDDTTERAADVMREHALRRLPVVDGDQLVGIVTLGDLAVADDRTSALADISAAEPTQ